jgi:hypothetical protein
MHKQSPRNLEPLPALPDDLATVANGNGATALKVRTVPNIGAFDLCRPN